MCRDRDWFLIRLDLEEESSVTPSDVHVSMMKDGCGLMIENTSGKGDLKSDIFTPRSLSEMIKHFGVVALTGFRRFDCKMDLYNF